MVVPAGSLLDHEYWRLAGDGAAVYFARTRPIAGGMAHRRALELGDPHLLVPAVEQLVAVRPDVIAFACTSASFAGGCAREAEIRTTIEAASGTPAVTTSGGLLSALSHLGAHRVVVATPYGRLLSEDLVRFVEEAGLRVVSLYTGGMWDPARVADLRSSEVRQMARDADSPDGEAVFLSCTNLPTLGLLEDLSRELGKPVLSSNLVTMWAALRAAGQTSRAEVLLPQP